MIKCKNCSAENGDSAKFCSSCGNKIGALCAGCGTVLLGGCKFCPECGKSVSASINEIRSTKIDISNHSSLSGLEVGINSVRVKGPDGDGDVQAEISFDVRNASDKTIGFCAVNTQVFSADGKVIGDTSDAYEEEIAPSESASFETSVWGLKESLFSGAQVRAQAAISVLGSTITKEAIYNGKLSDASPSSFGSTGSVEGIRFLSGSYRYGDLDDDGDQRFELLVLLQNQTPKYYPRLKLLVELYYKKGKLIYALDDYQELMPFGLASPSVTTSLPAKEIKDVEVRIFLEIFETNSFGLALAHESEFDSEEINLDNGSERGISKTIYIKTEPGGRVMFGRLSNEDQMLLENALIKKQMPESLLELTYNGSGDFREYEGVFNQGGEGDFGNEGLISIDADGPVEIPKDRTGRYVDGAYLVYLSLSKVSIEFKFEPSDGAFDSQKFTEVCVPINLPDFIEHETYGRIDGNVVIDYLYDGEPIDEYTRELVDRGYDDLTAFVIVKNGSPKLVYSNSNGEEVWREEGGGVVVQGDSVNDPLSEIAALMLELAVFENIFVKGSIPEKKLQNAIKAYAPELPPDDALLLLDDTVFGSAKEGLIVTMDAIYGHALMSKPLKIYLKDITCADVVNETLNCFIRINQLKFMTIATGDKKGVAAITKLIAKLAAAVRS